MHTLRDWTYLVEGEEKEVMHLVTEEAMDSYV